MPMALIKRKIITKFYEYLTVEEGALLYIKRGDNLCSYRGPMDCKLLSQIKAIYNNCRLEGVDKPLLYASLKGYSHIVWGFIECAKQTNTNLHTGEIGELEVQNFLWLRNEINQTALDVAIENNQVDVAKLLLENATLECLISERDQNGKVPISMLYESEHDEFIISILETAKRTKSDRPTSTLVHIVDTQGEAKVYSNIEMHAHSYPKSHKSEARASLDKLNSGKLELTPRKNTILHLVTKFGDIEYVNDILKEHPSLLYFRNSEGETPAYVAAREGHMDILEIMIDYFKLRNDPIDSLVIRTTDNNSALHVAIQNHHVSVVCLLIKEIPHLANHINNSKESPIYLAAERSYAHLLRLVIPDKCQETTFEGPNGKTSLHAAASSGSTESIIYLLSANRDQLYIPDNDGRTPLRYAVHHNNSLATEMLLNADTSLGYEILIEDGVKSSVAHIASSEGHCETLKVVISKCPGSPEMTDVRGRNILHVAIDNKNTEVIEYIFKDESLTYLINQKDNDGNTPIHLFMASELDMIEKVMDSRVDVNVLNNQGNTPLDMASSQERRKRLLQAIEMGIRVRNRVLSPNIRKMSEEELDAEYKHVTDLLVVITLIATATFAAAFTVPGGSDGNEGSKQGMPILLKKAAFQAFMVCNTLAFSFSSCALSGYICLLAHRIHYKSKPRKAIGQSIIRVAGLIDILTGYAILTMAIAFATGIYVVLTPYPGLAIFLCFITLFIVYGCTSIAATVVPR